MNTLPETWPFPSQDAATDQRAATITGEAIGLIDNVTMPRNPSAGRRPPLTDIPDAPY